MNVERRIAWPALAAFAFTGLASGVCSAQAPADSPSPCASVSDDKSRLQCYDAEHAMRSRKGDAPSAAAAPPSAPPVAPAAAVARAPAPAPAAAASPPAQSSGASGAPPSSAPVQSAGTASSPSDFGSEMLPKKVVRDSSGTPLPKESLVARVVGVTGRRKGEYRIELDNGQVWAETQRTGGEAPAAGETVTVRPGMMGSYFLSREAGLALRVKRIK